MDVHDRELEEINKGVEEEDRTLGLRVVYEMIDEMGKARVRSP